MIMRPDLESILNDNRSGSLTITKKSFDLFRQIVEEARKNSDDLEAVYKDVQNASKTLVKRQPNMVMLRKTGSNFLNYFKRILKSDKERDEILETIAQKVDQLEEEVDQNINKIAHTGSRIIANGNKIMTLSNSTIVKSIFDTANAQKRRFEVFNLKSHPPDEGITMSEYLLKQKIKVTLLADAEMGIFMPDMNLVLLGAERLFENGFVSKSGALPLCLTAKHFNIPVYLAVETTKILLESERAVKQIAYPGKEIYQKKNKKLTVENIYFEKVPLNLIHKVISEEGVFETFEFINWYLKE